MSVLEYRAAIAAQALANDDSEYAATLRNAHPERMRILVELAQAQEVDTETWLRAKYLEDRGA